MKIKNVIVISLIFTILFAMLPTKISAATYDEETATEAYVAILENCIIAAQNTDGTAENIKEVYFQYGKKMLDVWYETNNNSSTLKVNEDNTGEQTIYTLEDDSGIDGGAVRRVFSQIRSLLENETLKVGRPAASYLQDSIMAAFTNNQVMGENEERLENYLIKKVNSNANVNVDFDRQENTNVLAETIGMALTGVAKVIYQPLKWIVFLVPGGIIQVIIEGIVELDGGQAGAATLQKILFNEVSVTNGNIFNPANAGANMSVIRTNISSWYMALRNLSLVISLCMLIYIGIRMALSSIAEKKAEYKEMLKNWFMGMLILFMLHYFMATLLNVNDALVQAIKGAMVQDESYANLLKQLLMNSLKVNVIKSTTAAICFLMLQGLTFGYLIMYIRRMLTISVLTCVAPLITTTYAMDKVGDKKSQVLNTWVKEYTYNVLMQPFHCIIYIVFVKNALDILIESPTSFAAAIIAVMCMSFMIIAEGIVKAIFGLQGNTMTSAASSIAAFAAGATVAANLSGKVKNARQKIETNVNKTNQMAKAMPKTQNKLPENAKLADKAKAAGGTVARGAGKALGAAKKLYLNPKLTGIQTAMLSGALGLATGDGGTALHSAQAGKAAGETLGAHMSEMDKRRQVSRNERMFENQFDEYQIANPNTDMKALATKILAGDKVPEDAAHFAASVIGLRDTYKQDGKQDPVQAVLDNIDNLKKYE